MKLERPLLFIDIEGTGVDSAKDRIVSLALCYDLTNAKYGTQWRFNPEMRMSAEVIAIHGITNEQASLEEKFSARAAELEMTLRGCDLAGFNLLNYDVPILWEEFHRAGLTWDLSGVRIIDAGNIFKKKEERTLTAAVKFYCGKDHAEAHSAPGDVRATAEVLAAQLARYPELAAMSVDELAKFSEFDKRFDLAGKIIVDSEGFPVYNIGKSKGVRVKDDARFAYWMLGKDFSQQTKMVLARYLESLEIEREQKWAEDQTRLSKAGL